MIKIPFSFIKRLCFSHLQLFDGLLFAHSAVCDCHNCTDRIKKSEGEKRGEFTVHIFWCKTKWGTIFASHSYLHLLLFPSQALLSVIFFWLIYLTAIPWGALCYNKDWGDLFSLSLSSVCRIYCPWWFGPYDDCRRGVSIINQDVDKSKASHVLPSPTGLHHGLSQNLLCHGVILS